MRGKKSRLAVGVAAAGACALLAACSPVKMGAAATVGSQRITITQLDNEVASFNQVYPKSLLKPAVRTMLVPVPKTATFGGEPLRDTELLAWCAEVVRSVLTPD